jgi:hypothetical protein
MDRPEARLEGTELTYVDNKPYTVAALDEFDPDLRLVWNRRHNLFQVMLRVDVPLTYWFDSLGYTTVFEPALQLQFDWLFGLQCDDNPEWLIAALTYAREQQEEEQKNPHYAEDRILENRAKIEAQVSDNWRYAMKWNRPQLLKAFRPLHERPGFTR